MIHISIVTYNRRDILECTLDAIFSTCKHEDYQLFITDNGSSDGTAEFIQEKSRRWPFIHAYCLPENLGTAGGRNAHWQECIGVDTVRMDDKVLPLAEGWLTALKRHSEMHHSIVATPYDPTVMSLHRIAPCVEYVDWPQDQGRGGPLIFIPAEVTEMLGAVDELIDGEERCLYGYDDCIQIDRAMLLGWHFGFTLRVPVEYLARANSTRRNSASRWIPAFIERQRQYRDAERDVFIPIESTYGYQVANGNVDDAKGGVHVSRS